MSGEIVVTDHPWSLGEAKAATREAEQAQRKAEDRLREGHEHLATAERAYREGLAARILEYRNDGIAVTMCGELARGDKDVAELKQQRDVLEGVLEARKQNLFRLAANRRDVRAFADWSMRREFAEGFNPESLEGGSDGSSSS